RIPEIPRGSAAGGAESPGIRRAGVGVRLGTIRGQHRPHDWHEHVWCLRAVEGIADEVWFHTRTHRRSRQGTSAPGSRVEKGIAMTASELWKRHRQYLCRVPDIGLTLDVSRMQFDDGFLERMSPAMKRAFEAMDALEGGAIANPDEKRMVGHYWLRALNVAPNPEIAAEIKRTIADIKQFAADVHSGAFQPPTAPRFTRVLV